MKDKSRLVAVGLVIIAIVVVIINVVFNDTEEKKTEENIQIVLNYSNFYTVNSCLYRTINYISQKDKKSLLLILSENYKKNNNINIENVINLFPEIDNDSNFKSTKMYYERISNNLTKYYVSGNIEKNQIYDDDIVLDAQFKEMFFIVYLDSKNKTFSIEPYDGSLFKEGE